MICQHCHQLLRFIPGTGWRHLLNPQLPSGDAGSTYMMRCKDCGHTKAANYRRCPVCGSKNWVDDHCATPIAEEK